nr:retrovirus-related Pol polyprotein from transposon TNT 1-94 [Tanacetum cinerariifolium]
MAAVEVLQTLEYRGGQLNATPILEVENFTNWKKRFMCHIIGIEPQYENIISNGPFVPMAAGQRKPEAQWTADERKAANLDQRLKSLIMLVLLNDQMNSVINCLTAKSTWDDQILYHEGPSDGKESRVIDLKLCYNTFNFKEGESLTQTFTRYKALMNELDFQDSLDDEEDTRSSHEYLNDLDEEYQAKALLAKSKRFFKKVPSYQSPFQPKIILSSENKPEMRNTKDFEAKYNKVKAKLALFSSSASAPSSFSSKKKGLIVESHYWDEEEVSSDDEETEFKALMTLTDEERISIGKESARNGEWTKITIKSTLHKSSEAEDSTLPNHDTNETIKSILKSKSMFKAETLKGITFNKPSSAPTRGNKSSLASKINSAHVARKSHLTPETKTLNRIISQRRGINHRNPQHVTKKCETCGSNVHTTSDHNDIEWFRKRETPYAKKVKSSNALRSKTPTKRGGIYEEVGLNTFRNAIGAHYLPHSSKYVAPPSIDVVRKWFPTIGKEATKDGSSKASTGSKTGHSKRRKKSSSAMDLKPNQPLVSTPVDTKMHKEDQQATGGSTSLRVTSEERTNPQLNSGMSALN